LLAVQLVASALTTSLRQLRQSLVLCAVRALFLKLFPFSFHGPPFIFRPAPQRESVDIQILLGSRLTLCALLHSPLAVEVPFSPTSTQAASRSCNGLRLSQTRSPKCTVTLFFPPPGTQVDDHPVFAYFENKGNEEPTLIKTCANKEVISFRC
jgi:hypothetical protein